MRWLIRLYPAAWKRRYGEEFAAILSQQRFSLGLIIDILAGALDAHVQPQLKAGTIEGKEDVMTNEMRRRCAAGGPALSTRDQKIASAAMVVSSLFFAIVYVVLSKMYHHIPAVEALGYTSFPAIFLLYSNFAYLRRRHWPIQLLFVVTGIVMLYSFMWGTCIVAARL